MLSRDELKERLEKIFNLVDRIEGLKRIEIKDLSTWAIDVDEVLDKIHDLSWFDDSEDAE